MTKCVHLDIETYSECDLKKCGVYVYAAHPSTELLCYAFAFDDEEPELWCPGMPHSRRLFNWIVDGGEVRAHNAQFERTVLNGVAGEKQRFPRLEINQMVCTAAKARAHGLPGALDAGAAALGTFAKDQAGKLTMLQLSKPRRGKVARYTPENSPDKFKILYAYNLDDVRAEHALDKAVPDLTTYELNIWRLDQKINDRGVGVDIESVKNAQIVVEQYKERLREQCFDLCGFKPTQYVEVAQWVRAHGYYIQDLQAETIGFALEDARCPENVKQLLKVVSTHNMKAVAKLTPMVLASGKDQRVRGMFMYCGAGPGRWSSQIVQLQNMARPHPKMKGSIDLAIDAFRARDLEYIEFLFPGIDPMKVVASTMRSMLVGQNGKVIQALDFAGIESRWTAWMFDEWWKLEAFRASDRGEGPDTYRVAYGNSFGVDPRTIAKDDPRRQIGKVMELAFGYEGGVGACITAAGTYGFKVEELAEAALKALSDEHLESAEWMWNNWEVKRGRPSGLEHDIYVGLDGLKQAWRASHPNHKAGWKNMIEAAKAAVREPGQTYMLPNGKIKFKKSGDFLYMRLPSGRKIAYHEPEIMEDTAGRESLTYMGIDTQTRQWRRTGMYGGRATENAAQGGSSDFLRHGIVELDREGYDLIMTVHDEVCCEVEPDFQSLKAAEDIFTRRPKWGADFPLAAEGFRAKRYRK